MPSSERLPLLLPLLLLAFRATAVDGERFFAVEARLVVPLLPVAFFAIAEFSCR
jgi:hypothetical protein